MESRQKAINQIKKLVEVHHISLEEIRDVLKVSPEVVATSHAFGLSELLSYIGGILIFAGVGVYTTMFWASMNSFSRVLLTFGAGFSCYSVALGLSQNPRYEKVTQALFLVSAILQPLGLFVLLYEIYGASTDSHGAILVVFGIMFTQQLVTFWEKKLSLLLFMAIFFGLGFLVTLFDQFGYKDSYILMGLGMSLFFICLSLKETPYKPAIGLWYFLATVMFLGGAFSDFYNTSVESLFAVLCGFVIYLSVLTRSKAILFTSSLSLLGYIGRYTWLHFVDSVGWPVSLIIIGIAFIVLSGFVIKLQRKFA
jgi:hypothetical protein